MELSDKVKYTESAAKRLNETEAPVSFVMQWPPAVRFARDEIEQVRSDVNEAISKIGTGTAETKSARAAVLARVADLANAVSVIGSASTELGSVLGRHVELQQSQHDTLTEAVTALGTKLDEVLTLLRSGQE